ncbi:hypothetical protein ACFUAC_21795 [Streptomyces sp. NPDC057148]|uniref:hypothetical protein n=1 Tax=unclassified Streptomyces TaxID=2593676 RepID=UPI003631C1E5
MKRSVVRAFAATAGVAAVVATAVVLRQPPPSEPADGTSSFEVQQNQRDVERYWTERRMAEAEPAPMPREE